MKPTAVEGGVAALALMRRASAAGRSYRLLLADAQMPDMDGLTLVREIQEDPSLSCAAVMMLNSDDLHIAAIRCRRMGVAYVLKPVAQAQLMAALLQAPGESEPPASQRPGEAATPSSVPIKLRILLAEDNAVSQQLAVRALEKQGCFVTVAGDGVEAVRMSQEHPFDLVLMDVQMPSLDGLEATRRIRHLEKKAGGHIPILAITAHAMLGDRKRCLDAGMDGYLSKPIRVRQLLEAVQGLASAPHGPFSRGSE